MKAQWIASVAVAAVLVGGGLAVAAVPDAQGKINGCVNNATGVVRIIDTAKTSALGKCITTPGVLHESALEWSQTGPAGPAGSQGVAGPKGGDGATGPAGPAGNADISSLTGSPCTTHDGTAGTVSVIANSNDDLVLHCSAAAVPEPRILSISVSPSELLPPGGIHVSGGTITLSAAVSADTTITVSSSDPAAVSTFDTVVLAGQRSVDFLVDILTQSSGVLLTFQLGGQSSYATIAPGA